MVVSVNAVSYLNYNVMRPYLQLEPESNTLPMSLSVYDATAKPDAYTSAAYTGSSSVTDVTSTGGTAIYQGRNKATLVSSTGISTDQTNAGGLDYVVSVNFNIANLFTANADVNTFCSNHFAGSFSEDVAMEPIYELILDTKVIGLYLQITDCRSSTHAYNKVVKLGFKIDSASGFTGTSYSLTLSSKPQ